MSVNVYAGMTKLTDVCGRVDYATSPDRQERLLATATTVEDPMYWKRLANDSQAAWRRAGGKRDNCNCCEGRELHGALPNSAMSRDLDQLAQEMAADFSAHAGGVGCTVGIHLNEKENNLHFHIIFSERHLLDTPEIRVADRNLFLDENGIKRRTKKEILNDDGSLREGCSIIPKGSVYHEQYFGDKDPRFTEKGWLHDYKVHLANWINEELQPDEKRTVFDPNGPYLAQQKIPKGTPEEKAKYLREWNESVKLFNGFVDGGWITEEMAREIKGMLAISPDPQQDLHATICAVASAGSRTLSDDQRATLEAGAATFGAAERTRNPKEDPQELKKQQLRDAYRRSSQAWAKVRAASNDLDRKILQNEAKKVSSEIYRLKRELGYDEQPGMADRRQAVWDASKEARETKNGWYGDRGQQKQLRSEAWLRRQEAKRAYKQTLPQWEKEMVMVEDGDWMPKWKKVPSGFSEEEQEQAQLEYYLANQKYQEYVEEMQLPGKAAAVLDGYRALAMKVAGDPGVPDAEAQKVLARYQAAIKRLEKPTKSEVKVLKRELADLQKSQELKAQKRAAQEVQNKETEKSVDLPELRH